MSALGELHQHIGRPCPMYVECQTPGVHQLMAKTTWGEFPSPKAGGTKKEAKGRAALAALREVCHTVTIFLSHTFTELSLIPPTP